jgi:hypothetical protein
MEKSETANMKKWKRERIKRSKGQKVKNHKMKK